VLYPYVVAGGYTVTQPGPGGYDARFGLIFNQDPPVCHKGYEGTNRRSPQDTKDLPMYTGAHCSEPASQSNARGSQHAPNGRAGASYRAPVASYDAKTGTLDWADQTPKSNVVYDGGAADTFGADSGRWLLLQTAMSPGE
jgi:phospholipid/cholesterol/gamma-HCH transport system substrate-binding protein